MTASYRDLWLSEMWKTCPELSLGARAQQRKADELARYKLEDMGALPVHRESTGCAETALTESA